jgi:decaprenyl-phosphate phosphoribosyltransferase
MRPKQWVKNLLVFASPAAAGVLDEGEYLTRSIVLFAAFCLAASGAYCLNDVADVEADRAHPSKCRRPLASGAMASGHAVALGVGLLVAGLLLSATTGDWEPVAILAVYVALQPAYSVWLKHVAVVDLLVVTAGFVLRAVIGVAGTDVPISDWYLIVASFGSLFLVAGKRASELELPDTGEPRRRSLEGYTAPFLLLVRGVALAITLLAYCLWAFEKAEVDTTSFPWFQLSIVPFTAALLRFALVHEEAEDAGPDDLVLGDLPLQVIGVLWGLCLAAGVYVADTPPLPG